MSVTVAGGLDAVRAEPDAIRLAGAVLDRTAAEIDESRAESSTAYWALWTVASLDAGAASLGSAQDALDSVQRTLDEAADDLRVIARRLRIAARLYEAVDALDGGLFAHLGAALGGAFGPGWHGLTKLPDALVTGEAVGLATGSPLEAVDAFSTSDPQLLDTILDGGALALLASATLLPALAGVDELLQHYFADGRPVVTPAGTDTAVPATLAPRSLTDLVDGALWRDAHEEDTAGVTAGGEIDVKFLHHADGSRSVIVDIPGTKDWSLRGFDPDVTNLASNLRAIQGVPTTYERGVLDAMQRAGVRPDDHVLLVGHSLGGMVAVEVARDAVRSGRFRVTNVVTAGSPVGNTVGSVPRSVHVLALENAEDLVPTLDGRANPATRNVLTVTADIPSHDLGTAHHLDNAYESVAEAAEHSGEPAVDYYLAGAEQYLDADSVRTERYVIKRR
jgi:pimeloyl-ACP methyl ester carboxylesterase